MNNKFKFLNEESRLIMKKLSWYWKRKPTWRNYLIICNIILGICFFNLIGYQLERMGEFEIESPRSGEWKNFGCRWTSGWGVLKIGQFSWTYLCIIPKDSSFYDSWSVVFEKLSSVLFVAFRPHSIFSVSLPMFFIEKLSSSDRSSFSVKRA